MVYGCLWNSPWYKEIDCYSGKGFKKRLKINILKYYLPVKPKKYMWKFLNKWRQGCEGCEIVIRLASLVMKSRVWYSVAYTRILQLLHL